MKVLSLKLALGVWDGIWESDATLSHYSSLPEVYAVKERTPSVGHNLMTTVFAFII